MARESDIRGAFMAAIKKDGRGRQIVTTAAFQKHLDDMNHVWTQGTIKTSSSSWLQRKARIRPGRSAIWDM